MTETGRILGSERLLALQRWTPPIHENKQLWTTMCPPRPAPDGAGDQDVTDGSGEKKRVSFR